MCWIELVIVASNAVIQILATFLLCLPSFVSPNWPILRPNDDREVHCANWDVLQYPSMIGNIVTSLMVFLIPLPKLWSLPMPLKAKASLFLIFGYGLL